MKPIGPLLAIFTVLTALPSLADPDGDPSTHADHAVSEPASPEASEASKGIDPALAHQMAELRDKLAQLEKALKSKNKATPNGSGMAGTRASDTAGSPANPTRMKAGKGMGMGRTAGMDMGNAPSRPEGVRMPMNANNPGMGSMGKMKMGGMGMMKMDKMKMSGMMGMNPMPEGAQPGISGSALPGFPGASHLYHLGATGFFLDHRTHISLSTKQAVALNKIKEAAALSRSASDRAIEHAEQELWMLSAADQPDINALESKVSEISTLVSKQRVAFIRAVGSAAKILSAQQIKILTGFEQPAPSMKGM